jgi:hypothetical protein
MINISNVDMIISNVDMIISIKFYAYLIPYLDYFIYLYNNCNIAILTVFILTYHVNFPCGS